MSYLDFHYINRLYISFDNGQCCISNHPILNIYAKKDTRDKRLKIRQVLVMGLIEIQNMCK